MKKLIIQPKFYIQLTNILGVGVEQFGAKVAYNFYTRVMNKVIALPRMPAMYPKNRFIESTDKKVYRNILIEKYAVLYSVTARSIHVITIYHTAINPETIKELHKE